MGSIPKHVIMFGGNSLSPNNTSLYEAYRQIGCIIYVDMNTHTIVNASFTTVNPLTNEFFQDILIGYDLSQGIGPVIEELRERTQLVANNAFIKAFESCYLRYQNYCQKKKNM